MSHYPPPGPHPPPYYPPPPHWPPPPHHPHHPPPHHPHHPPTPHHPQPHTYPSYPYFVPGTMMVPVPTPTPAEPQPAQPTYITNYIYHGESLITPSDTPSIPSTPMPVAIDQVQVVETSGDYDWIPSTATTASQLTGRAVVGGHEGWDGSPLWIIRAWHNGDLIPGKLSVRHNAASIMYDGKEIAVQNIDVLCAKPDNLRWVPASNGSVPPGAIAGGRTASGEPLYVGRARHQLSVTPGKVQASHNCCYIGFAGAEVSHKVYDVLSRIS